MKTFFSSKLDERKVIDLKYIGSEASKLNHPNILKYEGVITNPPNYSLVSQFIPFGSLQSYLASNVDISYTLKLQFARQIAYGLVFPSFFLL